MPVTEVLRAMGSWTLTIKPEIPRDTWDALGYFGHVAIMAGPMDPRVSKDSLLDAARYVGVLREKDNADTYTLGGPGMAMWLGDEDGKGSVIESLVTLTAQTFENSVRAILPPATSAILEGTYFTLGGAPFTGTFQYITQREALNYLADTMGGDWKVRGSGVLDTGPSASLFVVNPVVAVVRRNSGVDMAMRAYPGSMATAQDMADFTTRVVLLGTEGEATIVTGTADINPVLNPFLDIHGNAVRLTRFISETATDTTNAAARAALQLNRFLNSRDAITLSTSEYDVKGTAQVGDYVWVYDPELGVGDPNNEVIFRGVRMNPAKLRLQEMTWPVVNGMSVAFRDNTGFWRDLTPYVNWETGDTSLVVGGYNRSLSDGADGSTSTGPILQPNTSVPNTPTFTPPFLQGTYQSPLHGETKSQTQLTWTQPTNTDSSVITDGDHYEIRFRSSTTPVFPVTHAQMAAYTHQQLHDNGGTFGQPIQYPVTNWEYLNVPWDKLTTIVYELTPSMPYEAQIRASDSGSPPNVSAWSASTVWQTVADTLPPAVPAAPEVSTSTIAVQVVHRLGKVTGGTFNMDRDLHHLELHGQLDSGFEPTNLTLLGKMLANSGMIVAQVPVVQRFQINSVLPVWFKVVAVDEAGNKSQASPGAVSTATLVDDAHISDLTVSKVTAGTINADFLVGANIKTSNGPGPNVILQPAGLSILDTLGNLAIQGATATGDLSIYGTGALKVLGGGGVEITNGSLRVKDGGGNVITEVGFCSDGRHGIQIYNDLGVLVSRMGELGDGSHGIEIIDETNGGLVKVSTLAFGTVANSIDATVTTTSVEPTYADLGGPSVSATIGNTGRAMVFVTSWVFPGSANAGGYASFKITGATTAAATLRRATLLEPALGVSTGGMRGAAANLVTGLNPGVNTFTMMYACNTGTADFAYRNIMVIPF